MGVHSTSQLIKDMQPIQPHQLYAAVVVDNADPTQKQRIRVSIPNILESQTVEELPWLTPQHLCPFGMGDNYGTMRVPFIGSRVWVTFQEGDVHFGVYAADIVGSTTTFPPELTDNYPNRFGQALPDGSMFYFDATTSEILFRQSTGTAIQIDTNGNVNITCAGDWNQLVQGNYTVAVSGNVAIVSDGTYTMTSSDDFAVYSGGDFSRTVGGSEATNVAGTRTISCSSELHAGSIEQSGDIQADGVSLTGHYHIGVKSGGDTSGGPLPG